MRYQNRTRTEIRLVVGDVRDAPESAVFLGRDPELRAHFTQRTGRPFATPAESGWLRHFPVETSYADDGSLSVMATSHRPRGSARRRKGAAYALQAAVAFPLVELLRQSGAATVALVPLSCRQPELVAENMIATLWSISVATFLNLAPASIRPPERFTIYSRDTVEPFVDALERRAYLSHHVALLTSAGLTCNRAKRTRFEARQGFPFRRVPGADET